MFGIDTEDYNGPSEDALHREIRQLKDQIAREATARRKAESRAWRQELYMEGLRQENTKLKEELQQLREDI